MAMKSDIEQLRDLLAIEPEMKPLTYNEKYLFQFQIATVWN